MVHQIIWFEIHTKLKASYQTVQYEYVYR